MNVISHHLVWEIVDKSFRNSEVGISGRRKMVTLAVLTQGESLAETDENT